MYMYTYIHIHTYTYTYAKRKTPPICFKGTKQGIETINSKYYRIESIHACYLWFHIAIKSSRSKHC